MFASHHSTCLSVGQVLITEISDLHQSLPLPFSKSRHSCTLLRITEDYGRKINFQKSKNRTLNFDKRFRHISHFSFFVRAGSFDKLMRIFDSNWLANRVTSAPDQFLDLSRNSWSNIASWEISCTCTDYKSKQECKLQIFSKNIARTKFIPERVHEEFQPARRA